MEQGLAIGGKSPPGPHALSPLRHPLAVAAAFVVVALGLKWLFAQDRLFADAGRAGRRLLADGRPAEVGAAHWFGLAEAGAWFVLPPLLILAAFRVIELFAGPRRERRSYRLVWITQCAFMTAAGLVNFAGQKLDLLPGEPLIRIGRPAGLVPMLAVTIPVYLGSLLFANLLSYWLHRAQHAIPVLWRFHAVHHSPRRLNVIQEYTHPFELVFNFALLTVPTAFLVGVDAADLWILTALVSVHHYYLHMDVPLSFGRFRAVVADNRYHFIHHSRAGRDWNTNFATNFPVFDMLFGTYRRPDGETLVETGIPGAGEPATFWQFLIAKWPNEEQAAGKGG